MRLLKPVATSRLLSGMAMLAALSCSDSTGPDTRASSDLHLLHVASSSPSLATTQVSFYAVKGKAAGADIWYHARAGASDSLKFIEFRMGALSLDTRPDGSAIAVGDSVQITLTVTDPTHLLVDFQPAGLTFAAVDQPTLKMYWVACGDDLNYDGVVDAADAQLTQSFSIWRQEQTSQPWFRVASFVAQDTKEVDAHLGGFTGYALAY